MDILIGCTQKEYEEYCHQGHVGKKYGFTWNSKRLMKQEYEVLLNVKEKNYQWESDERGHLFPVFNPPISMEKVEIAQERKIHILMNTHEINQKWCYSTLRKYIRSDEEVCILPFSFFDQKDYEMYYSPTSGMEYQEHMNVFLKYGIQKKQIHWVDYFNDSKVEIENKIMNSSLIFLLGGAPDLMMKRIKEKRIKPFLKNYQGIVLGYSAGAMVQLKEYHITPDEDYSEFGYYNGLGVISGFDIEPHFTQSKIQMEAIEKVKKEKQILVYGIYDQGGIVINDSDFECFGKVDRFE